MISIQFCHDLTRLTLITVHEHGFPLTFYGKCTESHNHAVPIRHLPTHVQSAFLADVSSSEALATEANLWMRDARMSRLRPAEWMLAAQNSWTCRTCMDPSSHHHPQSHLNTTSRMSSSTLSPTFPMADHSASTENIRSTLLLHVHLTSNSHCKSLCNCSLIYGYIFSAIT